MPPRGGRHEPIRQSVHVNCPVEEAFQLFTEGFADWWPLASYSITDDEAETCGIEPWVGGRVFERTRSGEELEWGSVTAWEPPEHLRFTWHPGSSGEHSQIVDVEFQADADGTRVTLIHTGWEGAGVAVCTLEAKCSQMWPALWERWFLEFVANGMLVTV